jgi:asparagine synthase (glutamine-hydrolysing)
MCEAQEHRGPDSLGLHVAGSVGLGIQRLRVIDLDTGDQPIYNEDRSIAVVLNGEIYNYAELRRDLRAAGHALATSGDTEVIAHLYEDLGSGCLSRLQGMFSFALWDERRRRLFIARDRLGKKPLYYCLDRGVLSFASELQALLQSPEVPRDIDYEAIDAYLTYGYIPAPLSAFRSIRKLPPAHSLTFEDGKLSIDSYWRLDFSRKQPFSDPAELDERIRDSLRRAVGKRLASDVPLGAFLSGGIDSSAVVAAMAEQSSKPVKTFSIGFADEDFNELPRAREVAERFSTDHHELVLEPDAASLLPKLVRHYGEPFADHSALPSFYLAEMASGHVTVALNGDGGDESFAGYQRYTSNVLAGRLDRIPAGLRRAIAGLAQDGSPTFDSRSLGGRARRFAGRLGQERHERYLRQVSIFSKQQREALYTPGLAARIGASDSDRFMLEPWSEASGADLLDQLLEVDTSVYLPGDLLAKIDIATMAFSLEARSPLLDHEFMEMAASIPADQKARGGQRKIAFRRALRGWLPDTILDGRKQGFQLPVGRWLRTDLTPLAREVLLDQQSLGRGWVNPDVVAGLIDQHVAGIDDHSDRLWALLVLELWADTASGSAPGGHGGAETGRERIRAG